MARRKRNYTVRTGDTASTIAKQLGIDPQTLMRSNTGAMMRPGEVLKAPPTPPQLGAATGGGGGLSWLPSVNERIINYGNQAVNWGQNVIRGLQPPTDRRYQYGVNDYGYTPPADEGFWSRFGRQFMFGETDPGALNNWISRPLGPNQVSLARGFQPYEAQGPVANWVRGLFADDTPSRQAYQTYDGSYVDQYGRRYSGGVDPRSLQAGRFGRGAPIDPRSQQPGRFRGATPIVSSEKAGIGAGIDYIPYDLMQQINYGRGAEGRATMAKLAALARGEYGGIVDVEAEDGSVYQMKVRDRGGGDVRYTPVSGATARHMARPGRSMAPRLARMRYGRGVFDSGKYKTKSDSTDKSSKAVGSAPRYQSGYNFDFDTSGGYMPMVRQRPRPGYLGLINWRI